MAYGDGKSSASEDCEVLYSGNKRELDTMDQGKWEWRKAGDPAAPAPSSSYMRPSSKSKRSRTEDAATDQSDPVCNKDLGAASDDPKCCYNQLAEETLPMRHQQIHQGAQSYKIDVPSLKAIVGGAGDVDSLGFVNAFIDRGNFLRVSKQIPTRTVSIEVVTKKSTVKVSVEGAGVV